jgi:hypothetical protein
MLDHFITNNQLPSSLYELSPLLLYLRSSFQGNDALENNTLASLGLGGQSVRFQLRFTVPFSFLSSSSSAVASVTTVDNRKEEEDGIASQPMVIDEKRAEESTECSVPSQKNPSSSSTSSISSLIPSNILPQPPPLTEEDYILLSQTEEAEGSEKKKQKQQQEQPQHLRSQEERMEVDNLPTSSSASSLLSPKEAMHLLLSSNFDAVSKPALITLTKYLLNVASSSPLSIFDNKYRIIKLENTVFQEKVLPCKGSMEFLMSVGFIEKKNEKILDFSSSEKNDEREGTLKDERSNDLLEEGINLLYQAMKELDIPYEDQPQRKARTIVTQSLQPVIPFDPFKPLMINASSLSSSQALTARTLETEETEARKGKSTTETQLEQLRKKRRELEGIPALVERKTEILFPQSSSSSSSSSVADSKSPATSERQEEGSSCSSASYLPKSVLQKLLSGNNEGPPLTTAAIRELQKLQNEKVYTETIIRIR